MPLSLRVLGLAWLAIAGVCFGQSPTALVTETQNREVAIDWYTPDSWQTLDGKPLSASWKFDQENCSIELAKPRGGRGSIVCPVLPVADFELTFDWKLEKGTNSGVKYRARQFGNQWLGIEYQLIDESSPKKPLQQTGAIYGLVPPVGRPPFATESWHQSRIRVQGNALAHYLDGQLVASLTAHGPDWQSRLARSKFYGRDGFGQARPDDRLMLTDHGGKIAFRKFRLVALPSKPPQASETRSPQLGNGMRNSWVDQSSIVIWTRTTQNSEMQEGPEFLTVDQKLGKEIEAQEDDALYESSQLPDGKLLTEVLGACPGAPGEVRLTYFHDKNANTARSTGWKQTLAATDFTAQWKIDDLRPGTKYFVVVEARPVGGEITAVRRGEFKTAPLQAKAADIAFCLTTCHSFDRRDHEEGHKIYPAMTALEPDFVVHAGDIEYYDKPRPYAWTKELMRFKWARLFALPRNREFYATHSTYFIKDDHDTLKNDCWEGQTYGNVTFEEGVQLFNEEQFPSRDPRYQTVRWGKDLQMWILEGRDFRSPNNMPDGPDKTILGEAQKAWLEQTLTKSDATFKLIFSPTPIVGPDRRNKKDNHANEVFAHEGEELRQLLSSIDGVIVFCGDRHWQYASVDEETGLWEFGCGPGSEKHQFGWKPGDERPVHRFLRVAGGFLSGSVTHDAKGAAKLVLRHRSVTGEQVSEFEF